MHRADISPRSSYVSTKIPTSSARPTGHLRPQRIYRDLPVDIPHREKATSQYQPIAATCSPTTSLRVACALSFDRKQYGQRSGGSLRHSLVPTPLVTTA